MTAPPLGVFDSGVGGLTVVRALRRRLPERAVLYLGDTARLPYGTKSRRTVVHYSKRNIEFLLARGVGLIVVACNTASALALDELEAAVPIVGVIEPGAERAAEISDGRVGVLATESTITSDAYATTLERLRPDLAVTSLAAPLLVPLVEEGWHDDPVAETITARYLEPLLAAEIDTLILGCTHYPMLRPVFDRLVGDEVRIVDSAEAVAEVVANQLEPAPTGTTGDSHFCVTDAADRFGRIARGILADDDISLELVDVTES